MKKTNVVKEVQVEVASQQADIISRLADAVKVDEKSFYEVIPGSDGSEVEIAKKVYKLESPIGKRSSVTVYDVSIIESMEKIDKALHGRTILNYLICKEMSKIAESGKLKNMGFKNIGEFGKAVYGLETSTVNHYVRIGSAFINDDYTVKAGLPELSVSHFIELNSLVSAERGILPIIELYQSQTLVDGMSTKAIRDEVRKIKNPQIEDKSTDKEEKATDSSTDTQATATPTESDVQELKANFDLQVAVGRIMNACTVIDELFQTINEHEIQVIGYEEKVSALKAMAKALL